MPGIEKCYSGWIVWEFNLAPTGKSDCYYYLNRDGRWKCAASFDAYFKTKEEAEECLRNNPVPNVFEE